MIDFPVKYNNGNCSVTITENGTKIREYEDVACPVYPESIDLKITNKCDAGCKFCHENSVPYGSHSDIEKIKRMFNGIDYPIEIAIGGGDPFSHPDLYELLSFFRGKGYISNITINSFHLNRSMIWINDLIDRKLVYGVGISYNKEFIKDAIRIGNKDNIVIHLINGYHGYKDIVDCTGYGFRKILILGYKNYGRGIKYNKDFKKDIDMKSNQIKLILSKVINSGITVAFDNLAIEQLNVKSMVKDFDDLYMGDEGSFTFYIDAVKKQFAVSSSDLIRMDIGMKSIKQMFSKVLMLK